MVGARFQKTDWRAWSVLAVTLTWAPSAAAQSLAGPFGELFGRTPERTGQEFTAIEFRSAVATEYDGAILDDSVPTGTTPTGGTAAGVKAGLGLERRGDRLRVSARGAATHEEFFRDDAFGARSYDAAGLVRAKVATRLSLEAGANWVRAPFFQFRPWSTGAFPASAVPVPGVPFAAGQLANETFEGTAGFTSQYTKRSALSASILRRGTRFLDEEGNDFEVWGVLGLWTRKLTRDFGARVAYGREEIEQHTLVGDGRFIHEVLDVGVDYLREMSVARRTSLSFNTQTSMIRETGGNRRYRLNGGLTILRGFRRTWIASITANRTTEFLPGFLKPIFSDGVSGGIGGLLARRVEMSASLGASKGRVGFDDRKIS